MERRELALALALLFGGTGLLALISWGVPAISGWLQALLALMLMTIPTWVLKGSQTSIDDLGVALGPARRTLGVALVVMALVTPAYLLGFHLLHGGDDAKGPDWSLQSLSRWDDEVRHRPAVLCPQVGDSVTAWVSGEGLWLLPPAGSSLSLTTDAPLSARPKVARCARDNTLSARHFAGRTGDTSWSLSGGQGLRVPLEGLTSFSGELTLDGQAAPLDLGAFRQSGESGRLDMSHGPFWIFTFFLVHLGLVALPEEWFFRGYLLARLDQRMGRPWRLLGVSVGPGLILSSLAFALLHPILIPGAHRLLVFFPALLFGWLREKTGNIGAAVVVHAACNLLQALAAQAYL